MIQFKKATVTVIVRKDYGACFDFYTKKLGLVPLWGDRNGPWTSFSAEEGGEECFAIFAGNKQAEYTGFTLSTTTSQPDTTMFGIPCDNVDEDYKRLKEAGVEFLGEPQSMDDWGSKCVYFRDPEGNLICLSSDIV